MYKFGKRSKENLQNVEPLLVKIMEEVIRDSKVEFKIICGHRSIEEQQKCFLAGTSNCDGIKNKSPHNYTPSRAVDIMCIDINDKGTWDPKYYKVIANAFKKVCEKYKVEGIWGGDFKKLVDCPHFEIKIKDDNVTANN